jgi:hypothetical protein
LNVLDIFNLCWAISGIFLVRSDNTVNCLSEFGYLAYIGIIFIVLGMATAVRMIYLIWFFGFGKKYFDYMKSKDEVLNQ